ncbi:MAG: helix-turn-helix transcriptional regulator [Acidobacteria bacterium]|nr:helix-turn-helix transcriptional regulator [Acidobacteriota bacterium]
MSKISSHFLNSATAATLSATSTEKAIRRTPLASLIGEHLQAKGLRQIDFCRQTGFDQGLLSKILSSVVNTLNVETTLKLAEGLDIPPVKIFEVMGKKEVDDLLRRFYSQPDCQY